MRLPVSSRKATEWGQDLSRIGLRFRYGGALANAWLGSSGCGGIGDGIKSCFGLFTLETRNTKTPPMWQISFGGRPSRLIDSPVNGCTFGI